jgi:hypothetical protein
MTKLLLSFLLAIMLQSAFAQNKEIETLKQLNQDKLSSLLKKDEATLIKILADDYTYINAKGIKWTKFDFLYQLTIGEIISINTDSAEVRMLADNVGVLTAYTTFVMKNGLKEFMGRNCYQDIYVKRNDKWMVVATHMNLLSVK